MNIPDTSLSSLCHQYLDSIDKYEDELILMNNARVWLASLEIKLCRAHKQSRQQEYMQLFESGQVHIQINRACFDEDHSAILHKFKTLLKNSKKYVLADDSARWSAPRVSKKSLQNQGVQYA